MTSSAPSTGVCGWQAALGELTFESEAADRLRAELRSAQKQAADVQQQLHQSQQQVQAGQDALRDAQQAAAEASSGTEEQQRLERHVQVTRKHAFHSCSSLLHALTQLNSKHEANLLAILCHEHVGYLLDLEVPDWHQKYFEKRHQVFSGTERQEGIIVCISDALTDVHSWLV